MSWQKEMDRPRPSRSDRTKVDDDDWKAAEEDWPSGKDKIMVALEALAWINRHAIRISRALRERLDEELLAANGEIELMVYDSTAKTSLPKKIKPHAFDKFYSNVCRVCNRSVEHILHTRPVPPADSDYRLAVELRGRIESDADQLLSILASRATPKGTE